MKKVYVILIIMALSISACKSNDREETAPVFDTSQAKNEQVMEDDVEESTIEQRKEDIFVPEQFGKIYMADEYEYMVLGANEVSIVKYIGNAANLNIPSDIKGATVTEIGAMAFYGNENLKEINIPAEIAIIRVSAFADCSNLEKIEFKKGALFMIEDHAFNSSNLQKCEIPDSVWIVGENVLGRNLALFEIKNGLYYNGNIVMGIAPEFDGHVIFDEKTSVIAAEALMSRHWYKDIHKAENGRWLNGGEHVSEILDDTLEFTSEIVSICDRALLGESDIKKYIIPSSVGYIGDYAIGYSIDSLGNPIRLRSWDLYGPEGSMAEEYAAQNGGRFIITE